MHYIFSLLLQVDCSQMTIFVFPWFGDYLKKFRPFLTSFLAIAWTEPRCDLLLFLLSFRPFSKLLLLLCYLNYLLYFPCFRRLQSVVLFFCKTIRYAGYIVSNHACLSLGYGLLFVLPYWCYIRVSLYYFYRNLGCSNMFFLSFVTFVSVFCFTFYIVLLYKQLYNNKNHTDPTNIVFHCRLRNILQTFLDLILDKVHTFCNISL